MQEHKDLMLAYWDSYLDYKSGTYMFVNMRKDPHIWFVLIALCFLIFVATGCKKARLRAQLKEMIGATVVLPKKINCIYNGELFPLPDSIRNMPKLIIYVDSVNCTTCVLSKLFQFDHLSELSKETGAFLPFVLISPKHNETASIEHYLKEDRLVIPVNIDVETCFRLENPIIPSDDRFHFLFTDKNGKLLWVGNPQSSDRVYSTFSKLIQNI